MMFKRFEHGTKVRQILYPPPLEDPSHHSVPCLYGVSYRVHCGVWYDVIAQGVDCCEFFCTLVILCSGKEMDKISFMFDAVDLDSDGYISCQEFSRFMHGVVNIRGALEQWESVKQNLNGEELRRVASGASDPLAQLLGQFEDTEITFDEEQKILKYFNQLDTDQDGLITESEFSNAVSTEMWAGILVRAFSRPVVRLHCNFSWHRRNKPICPS